jgi:general secretion pathway protein C
MNINFSSILKYLVSILIVVCLAFLLNFILYIFLPKQNIQDIFKQRIDLDYDIYNIKKLYNNDKIIKQQKAQEEPQNYSTLKNIKLKAIYATKDTKGWTVLTNKNNITHILHTNEKFKKYTLMKVFANYVIFSKDKKEYVVQLQKKSKIIHIKDEVISNYNTKYDENIIALDDKLSIKRAYLNSYINNSDKIWKSISVKENKNSLNQIDGFKVTRIKKNSVFNSLGLKKGDIIKTVNNIKLKSYNDAFKIYKKINNIKDLNMKIIRDNENMELNYEIE